MSVSTTNDCTLTLTGVREYELTQLASVQPLQWRGLTVSRASSVWITHRQWERVYSWELPASHMLTLTQPHHSPLWLALLLKLPHQVHYGIWADAFSLVHFSSLSESQHLFLHFFCWGSIIVPSSVSSLHRSSIPPALLNFCLLHLFQCSPFSRWLTTQPSLSHPLSLPPSASVSHSILVTLPITRTSVRSLWLLTSILSHHQSNCCLLQHPSLSIDWPGSNDPVVALSTEPPSGVPHPHHSAFHSNPLYLSVQSSGKPQLENGNFHSPHMHWHTLLLSSSSSSSSLSRSGQRCVWFPPSAI